MMKTHITAGALCLALGFSAAGGDISERKMSWAHHTPWHTPFNSSISVINYYNFPLLDCSGSDVEDWKREFAQAKAQGIDGFFPDLVANPGGGNTAFVEAMHTMLKAAEGMDFQIGACLDVKTNVEHQVRELKRMLDLFGSHPNYPTWKGRPVVNFYTFLRWKPEELAAIRHRMKEAGHDIFIIGNIENAYQKRGKEELLAHIRELDMLYPFGMMELDGVDLMEKRKLYEELARENSKELMLTVYPGYYGAWLNGRNDFYQVHEGFDQAHRSFESALSPVAKHLHFTTWNDHDETSFLPMVFTPGNALITQAYSRKFKGENPLPGKPKVLFAYHREELPGTLLRFEVMTLPGQEESIEVAGRLLDHSGKPVADLPAKRLNGRDFDRAEWLVPSTGIAATPSLTPEFTVDGEPLRLPEMLFLTGWHQNAVTVKIAASQVVAVKSTLEIKESEGILQIAGNYDSPEELKQITLWRNDRPIALLAPETEGKTLFNLSVTGKRDFTVVPENGSVLCGVKKFSENGSDSLQWDAKEFSTKKNFDWAPAAIAFGGTPDLILNFKITGGDPLRISARELAERERLEFGGLVLHALPVDATLRNRAFLEKKSGRFTTALFSRAARRNDRFQLRFETMDGRSGWSPAIYPFAGNPAAFQAKVVETATNLETPSGATGRRGRNEYLSAEVPFRIPTVKEAALSPLSIRGGHWDFEGDGRDQLGDMPVIVPASLFEENALRFTGKEKLKMRLRTYPVGAATIDFKINPDSGRKEPQGIIIRSGWSDALNIYLGKDGRIEVVRDGNEEFKTTKVVSKNSVPDDSWSRVRITCDNAVIRIYLDGVLDTETPVPPDRSYGNCTAWLGSGDKRSGNFTGRLDDLTILGAAFAPGEAGEPEFTHAKAFPPLSAPNTPAADPATAKTGEWQIPAGLRQEGQTIFFDSNANTGTIEVEGIELSENTMVTIPLRRFERKEPLQSWYAVLFSICNDRGQSLNFNFGSSGQFMITVNEPEWKIRSGHIQLTLPAELSFAKRGGELFLLLNGRTVYRQPDNSEAPYTRLKLSTSSPNRSDTAVLEVAAPVFYRLR